MSKPLQTILIVLFGVNHIVLLIEFDVSSNPVIVLKLNLALLIFSFFGKKL